MSVDGARSSDVLKTRLVNIAPPARGLLRMAPAMASVVVVLFTTAAVVAPPTPAEARLQDELAQTRRQLTQAQLDLEDARKTLRFGPDAAQTEHDLREEARRARIPELEIKAVPASEASAPSALTLERFDISGRASYELVDNFLHRLTIAGAGIDFQDLRIEAAPDRTIAFELHLVYPVLRPRPASRGPAEVSAAAPGATPRERAQAEREAVVRRMIEAEREELQYVRAAAAELRNMLARFRARDTINALAAFASEMEFRAIALTSVRVSDRAVLRGLAAGGRAAKAIRPALEQAGFEVASIDLKREELCTSFTAVARLADGERPLEVGLNNGPFDEKAPAICHPRSPAPTEIDVRGSGPGGVTLRVRDADPATILLLLHDGSGENFVVGRAGDRRFNVTATNAKVPDVLERLGAAGLAVSGGHVHRLPSGAFREQTWSGQPVNFVIRDAELAGVLCVFRQVSQLPILMRKDLRTNVSAFLKDVPWDEALASIIASAGETYAIDGNRLFVGTKGGDPAAVDACGAAASPADAREWWRGSPELKDVEAADLSLAGLAYSGGQWKAYAYGPMRRVWPLEADARLADARVKSIGPEGATLETGDGRRIDLRFAGK